MKKIVIILIVAVLAACSAEIGDACDFNYDCSVNLDRNCDPTQPGGYCLILGCNPDECPEEAVCVEFIAPCPVQENGEPIENCDLIEPNRTRTYCLRHCSSNGDCRKNYHCQEVEELEGEVIDFKGNKTKICVPKADES